VACFRAVATGPAGPCGSCRTNVWASTLIFHNSIPLLHTDVIVCACTSCRSFVITSKDKGVVAELLDTVAKHRYVQKISVFSE